MKRSGGLYETYPKASCLLILTHSMERRAKSCVRCSTGLTKFPIKVRIIQGLVLSPLLCITIINTITHDIQKAALWNYSLCAKYACDNVTMAYFAAPCCLAASNRHALENDVCKWKAWLQRYDLKLNMKKIEHKELGIQTDELMSIGERFKQMSTNGQYSKVEMEEIP